MLVPDRSLSFDAHIPERSESDNWTTPSIFACMSYSSSAAEMFPSHSILFQHGPDFSFRRVSGSIIFFCDTSFFSSLAQPIKYDDYSNTRRLRAFSRARPLGRVSTNKEEHVPVYVSSRDLNYERGGRRKSSHDNCMTKTLRKRYVSYDIGMVFRRS